MKIPSRVFTSKKNFWGAKITFGNISLINFQNLFFWQKSIIWQKHPVKWKHLSKFLIFLFADSNWETRLNHDGTACFLQSFITSCLVFHFFGLDNSSQSSLYSVSISWYFLGTQTIYGRNLCSLLFVHAKNQVPRSFLKVEFNT